MNAIVSVFKFYACVASKTMPAEGVKSPFLWHRRGYVVGAAQGIDVADQSI